MSRNVIADVLSEAVLRAFNRSGVRLGDEDRAQLGAALGREVGAAGVGLAAEFYHAGRADEQDGAPCPFCTAVRSAAARVVRRLEVETA